VISNAFSVSSGAANTCREAQQMIRDQDQTRTLAAFQPLNGSSNVQMAMMPMNPLARTSLSGGQTVGQTSGQEVNHSAVHQFRQPVGWKVHLSAG